MVHWNMVAPAEFNQVGDWRIAFGGATFRQVGAGPKATLFALRFDVHDPAGRESQAACNVEDLTSGGYSFWAGLQPHQQERLPGALERLLIDRLEQVVAAGSVEPGVDPPVLDVDSEDIEDVMAFVADKLCQYQSADSFGHLECNIWTPSDGSPAPTTRALCRVCELPDSGQVCAHLRHPHVTMYESPERPSIAGASCDIGRDEVRAPSRCYVGEGGHSCASRLVRVSIQRRQRPAISGRQLVDSLDHLSLAWREATGKRLVEASVLGPAAALGEGVATLDDVGSRLTSLAALLKQWRVDDALLTAADLDRFARDAAANQPINRMIAAVQANIREVGDLEHALEALRVLRSLNGVRNAVQHPESRRKYREDLKRFGLDGFVADWTSAWSSILADVNAALGDLRMAIETSWA